MNRRTLIKSIFVAPLAAFLGTKIVHGVDDNHSAKIAERPVTGMLVTNAGELYDLYPDIRKGDMVVMTPTGPKAYRRVE